MEDSTIIPSNEANKAHDLFANLTARNAFKLVSDAVRLFVQGKQGQEIKCPTGKQVVYDDGSSYFLGVDDDGTFRLSYSGENPATTSELQYHLYRNGSQLVRVVSDGKIGHVRFSINGSKQYENFE